MEEKATQLSSRQLYSPLRNWCIGLAFTAGTVVASDFWLDQPIASFVYRNITDKTIFAWLHRLPLTFLLLSLLVFLWCGFYALTNRPFSRLQCLALRRSHRGTSLQSVR